MMNNLRLNTLLGDSSQCLNARFLILLIIGCSFTWLSATSPDPPKSVMVVSTNDNLGWDEKVTLCLPNEIFEIDAKTPFGFMREESTFNWRYDGNAIKISDLKRADPAITPIEPGTYTIALEIIARYRNLVVNGDFSSPITTLGIDYTDLKPYDNSGNLDEREYAVGINSQGLKGDWWDCSTPSDGSDHEYMTINSKKDSFIINWQQNIRVEKGVCYEFGAVAVSVENDHPPTVGIRLKSGGKVLAQGTHLKLSDKECDWKELSGSWTSDMSGPVELCIYNIEGAKSGHDFSIDDIYFRRISDRLIDEIEVTIGDVIGADIATQISCFGANSGAVEVSPKKGVKPYVIDWEQLPGQNTLALANLVPRTYDFTLTDSLGCNNFFQITIAEAPPIKHRLETQKVTCFGGNDGSAAVFAAGADPLQLLWSTGSTNSQLPMLHAGPYGLTITDKFGCTKTDALRILQPDEVHLQYRTLEPSCHGIPDGTVFIDHISGGTPPFWLSKDSLLYRKVGTGPVVLDNLAGGSYAIVVEDTVGCASLEPVYLSQPEEVRLDLGPDQTLEMGKSFQIDPTTLSGALTRWQWRGDELSWLSCTDCPDPLIQPLKTSTFELTIADANDCSATDSIVFFIVDPEVYIPNAFTPNGDDINDRITVYGGPGLTEIHSLRIFDRWGIRLFEEYNLPLNDESRGWDGRFHGQEMDVGVYILVAEVDFLNGRRQLYKQDITLIR